VKELKVKTKFNSAASWKNTLKELGSVAIQDNAHNTFNAMIDGAREIIENAAESGKVCGREALKKRKFQPADEEKIKQHTKKALISIDDEEDKPLQKSKPISTNYTSSYEIITTELTTEAQCDVVIAQMKVNIDIILHRKREIMKENLLKAKPVAFKRASSFTSHF